MRSAVRDLALWFALWVLRPVRDLFRTLRRRHPVRIFTFHRVHTEFQDGMTVDPATLRDQVRYIKKHHRVVSLEEALGVLRGGARVGSPLAVLTFDDGYRSVYDLARPIMQDVGVVGTCFITTDLVGTDRRFPHDDDNPFRESLSVMDWPQLRDLLASGWSIGAHTKSHPRLSTCDRPTLEKELREPKDRLTHELGLPDMAFAYPFGGPHDITEEGIRLARETGYSACLRDYDGENFPTDDFMIGRIEIGGKHSTLAWKARAHGIDLSNLGGRWKAAAQAR